MRLEAKTNQLLSETMNTIVTMKAYVKQNLHSNVISKEDKLFLMREFTLHMHNIVNFYETANMDFAATNK